MSPPAAGGGGSRSAVASRGDARQQKGLQAPFCRRLTTPPGTFHLNAHAKELPRLLSRGQSYCLEFMHFSPNILSCQIRCFHICSPRRLYRKENISTFRMLHFSEYCGNIYTIIISASNGGRNIIIL